MYSEKVLDHFTNPRNVGEIPDADGVGEVGNARCGDIMKMYLKIDGDTITDVKFKTFGCGAAIATSSIATEMIKGRPVSEALELSNKAVVEALDGLPAHKIHCSVLAEEAVKHCDLPGYRKRAVALLDEQMGAVPDSFLYRGRSYTARSFADSLRFKAEDYVQLTSFTHHPFYTPFILEVPDNWEHQCYFNLPLDELEQVVRRALSAGKTVAWHGDVSEDTFSPRQGMALWTQHPVTQEMRQHEFERFLTTDDHMMHLIGTAHDEAGRFYYLLKNSYGRYGAYAGLLYMSEDYFRAKTVSVLLRK